MAQLKQRLHLLARCGNGSQECGFTAAFLGLVHGEAGGRCGATLDLQIGGQFLAVDIARLGAGNFFQLHVVLLQHRHYFRIVALTCLLCHPVHGFIERQRAAIRPVGRQRVETIHCGEDAGADGNLFALEASRIPCTVPPLVMRTHDWSDGIRELHPLQYFRAHDGMDLHLFEFFRSQRAGLGDNVLGNRQFADVVQQRRRAERLHLVGRKTQPFGYFNGVDAHTLQMIVRGMVFGLNRQRQGLNRPQLQSCHGFHVPLFIFQFAQVHPVGAIDHEHGRESQQGRLPVDPVVHPAHHARDGCSHQVIGKRPEIAIRPDLSQPLGLGKGNDRGHRKRVQDEVSAGGKHQQQRRALLHIHMQWAVVNEVCRPDRGGRVANIKQKP